MSLRLGYGRLSVMCSVRKAVCCISATINYWFIPNIITKYWSL
jgi:hypothetical protein